MRVLFISDVYFPRVNGVSTSIRTFRADLAAAGVETAAGRAGLSRMRRTTTRDDATNVVRVPSIRRAARSRRSAHALGRAARGARAAGGAALRPGAHSHAASWRTTRASASRVAHRIPVVATYHTFFEEYLHHYVPLLPRPIGRVLARRFTRSQCSQLDAIVVPVRADARAAAASTASRTRVAGHSRPGCRPIATCGAMARAFARTSASRPIVRCCCTSGAWRTRRTSSSCCTASWHCGARARMPCSRSPARGRRARTWQRWRCELGIAPTCISSAISIASATWPTATPRPMCSCSRRAPKRRGWCCSRRWRRAGRWCRRRISVRPRSCSRTAARAWRPRSPRPFAQTVLDVLEDPQRAAQLSRAGARLRAELGIGQHGLAPGRALSRDHRAPLRRTRRGRLSSNREPVSRIGATDARLTALRSRIAQ